MMATYSAERKEAFENALANTPQARCFYCLVPYPITRGAYIDGIVEDNGEIMVYWCDACQKPFIYNFRRLESHGLTKAGMKILKKRFRDKK